MPLKALLLFLTILNFTICLSQTERGLIRYGEIQSLSLGAPIGVDYNAILMFDNNSSLYITRKDSLEKTKIDGQKSVITAQGGSNFTAVTNKKGFQYNNLIKKDSFYSRDLGFNYVKGKTPKISWKIEKETKNIGQLTCQKATATFRGRDYTAWFAPDIPLPYGPWKLQGLPGIILEAYDTNKEIFWYFKSFEYPVTAMLPSFKQVTPPKGKDWISIETFKETLIKNFKESQIAGKIVAEKMNIETYANDTMKNSYIEVFDVEDK